MSKVVILGAAGNSLEILDAVLDSADVCGPSHLEVLGFLDDDPSTLGRQINGFPVLGGLARARELSQALFVNGIGSTRTYKRKPDIIDRLEIPDDRFATVVHPSAVVSRSATIGVGTVVLQNAVVSSGATLGRHVLVLPLTVISHDARVDDFATIAGGAAISGHVHLGRACYVGTNASLREGVRIGDGALVGMGSVVLRDVPADTTVAGVPAVELSSRAKAASR